jgi:hypothetical protein
MDAFCVDFWRFLPQSRIMSAKAESTSVLVVFSRRKLMLDDDAYLHWLD